MTNKHSETDGFVIIDPVYIPIDRVKPNTWNPNEQDPSIYNALVDDIESDGFDQSVIVVPENVSKFTKLGLDKYLGTSDLCFIIIDGEHRWKACNALQASTIPCIIKTNWNSEADQKIKTVRRNILHGKLNKGKFTALVNNIVADYGHSIEQVCDEMGFSSFPEFWKNYQEEKASTSASAAADAAVATADKVDTSLLDSLNLVISTLLDKYGDTIPYGFLWFLYKRHNHLVAAINDTLYDAIDDMVNYLRDGGCRIMPEGFVAEYEPTNINEFLTTAIRAELDKRIKN